MGMDATAGDGLTVEKKGAITRMSFDRTLAPNARQPELLLRLQHALRSADREEDCCAILLSGSLSELLDGSTAGTSEPNTAPSRARLRRETIQIIEGLRPVTIALESGEDEEGSVDLSHLCDLAMAKQQSESAAPMIKWATVSSSRGKAKLSKFADRLIELEPELLSMLNVSDIYDKSAGQRPSSDQLATAQGNGLGPGLAGNRAA